MKRSLIILCAALAIISFSTGQDAYAVSYEFSLGPGDLNLNHNRAYTWGLNLSLEVNETITGASFTLQGINNWAIEPDFLYVHLLNLDSVPEDEIKSHNDNTNGDYFNGKGIHLFTYSDENQYPVYRSNGSIKKWENPAEDFTYNFNISNLEFLTSYLGDGIFGFGLDPDCRYYFTEIKFTVWTEMPTGGGSGNEIPEPGTLVLLGSGIIGLAFFRRYNLKK